MGLIFAAALWSAWSTIDRYFIGDDFTYVARFFALPFAEWPNLFISEWSGGIWGFKLRELRPFTALTFLVDAQLWGVNPMGYHITNLILDAACGWLVAAIGWRVQPERLWVGVVAGVLFVVHPAHAETVGWITGRVDVLATAAYLSAFWAGISAIGDPRKRWFAACWLAYFIGCFSKEFVLTAPLMVVVYALIFRRRFAAGWWKQLYVLLIGCLVIVAIYARCRHIAFSGQMGGDAPASLFRPEYVERQITYLSWMFPPVMKTMVANQAVWAPLAGWILGTGLMSAVGLLIVWRLRAGSTLDCWRAAAFFGLVWYLMATLPLTVAGYFSPRHLYLATAGYCLAVPLIVDGLMKARWLKMALLLAMVCCSLGGISTREGGVDNHARWRWSECAGGHRDAPSTF